MEDWKLQGGGERPRARKPAAHSVYLFRVPVARIVSYGSKALT